VYDVVLLTLEDAAVGGCANAGPRVPVLACRDALVAGGAAVEIVTATSDSEIDEVLDREARLVVAATTDGQVRAVVRRMIRRYAPAPSERPGSLPDDRTLPDLPPIGILPMGKVDLVSRLGLPGEPAAVAAAVLGGQVRRLDLLRNDGGSVTLHGTLLGSSDDAGRAVPFAARVEVDDAVLTDGSEALIATAVANAAGYAELAGMSLAPSADAADGVLDVAVALPVRQRRLFRRSELRIEVRRAHGRAVAVHPSVDVPFVDDGVAGTLGRRRTWWMERGAWAVYA
jgi:YegS C-terminal NAD kinase beta sandwich-like domain/Diacylglycerol kinase catalytic domain